MHVKRSILERENVLLKTLMVSSPTSHAWVGVGPIRLIFRSSPHQDDLREYQRTDKDTLHKPLFGRSTFYQTPFWIQITCVYIKY